MIWAAFLLGLALTLLGSMAGRGAGVREPRGAGAGGVPAVARRLLGADVALPHRVDPDRSGGHLGVRRHPDRRGLPRHLRRSGLLLLAPIVALVAVPFVLFSGYLAPRWLTASRADRGHQRGDAAPRAVGPPARRAPARPPSVPRHRVPHPLARGRGGRPPRRRGPPHGRRRDDVRQPAGARDHDAAHRPDRHPGRRHAAGHRRRCSRRAATAGIPVYRGTLDEIVGMLHAFDLFKLRPGDPLPLRPVAVAAPGRAGRRALPRHAAGAAPPRGRARRVRRDARARVARGPARGAGRRDLRRTRPAARRDAPAPGGSTLAELDGATPTADVAARFAVALPARGASTIGGLLAELAGPDSGGGGALRDRRARD